MDKYGQDTQATKYYVLLCIVKSKSPKDYFYISFIEGLHRHAAILLCLTCSCFDLQNNTLQTGSLKQRHFQDVLFYKRPNSEPIEVLNEIINNNFSAKMLPKSFPVQVIYTSNHSCQIQSLFKTLIESSTWISTNKRSSAEKQISTRLSEALQQVMTLSTENERNNFRPKLVHKFKYQRDLSAENFQQSLK